MGDKILEFVDITRSFFGVKALEKINLQLKEGEIFGLIGENGAGKSTLMNILGGILPQDEGCMLLDTQEYKPGGPSDASAAGIEFIHQELNLFMNLTVAENIYIHNFPTMQGTPIIRKREIIKRAKDLLESLGMEIQPTALLETLAPGERQMVEIAKALSMDARIYIFDEPTTSLTAKETTGLFNILKRLRNEGKTIIYISHILGDVEDLADSVAVLRDGKVMGSGPIQDFSIDKMISLMVGGSFKQIFPEKKSIPQKEKLLEIQELSQSGTVKDINFSLHKGEILGVFGLMGAGRTEMARMVFGVDPYSDGEVYIEGEKLPKSNPMASIEKGLAFVTEDRREEGLLMDVPIVDNLGMVALPDFCRNYTKIVNGKQLNEEAEHVSERLHLKATNLDVMPAKSLSGGNQQKVVIGKWLLKTPRVLIMDEPTRGIDVGAKYEVFNIINDLADKGAGILMISSEVEELIGVCDRIVVMSRGEIMDVFEKEKFTQEAIMRSAFRQGMIATATEGDEDEIK